MRLLARSPRILAAFALVVLCWACNSCGTPKSAEVRRCTLIEDEMVQAAPFLGQPLEKAGNLDEKIEMRVQLPTRNSAGLDAFLKELYTPESPQYLKFLTPEQFRDRFHPSYVSLATVRDHLVKHGMQVDGAAHGTTIKVTATRRQAQAALQADFRSYLTPDGVAAVGLAGRLGHPNLPPVLALHGAGDQTPRQSHASHSPLGTLRSTAGGFSAADIRRAYELPDDLTAPGQTIGFVQLDGFKDEDLDAYAKSNHLRRVPTRRVLIGKENGKVHDPQAQVEVTMDLELANALAPDAKEFVVYTAQNSSAGWHDMLNEIANPRLNKGPLVRYITCSWGTPEEELSGAAVLSEHNLFRQMAAQGIFFASASGDLGSRDGNPGHTGVDSPAAQRWVLGVGGSSLSLDEKRLRADETAWSGSGGGVSCYWPNPWWQTVRLGKPEIDDHRNVPDVSLHANASGPSGTYVVIVNGQPLMVGGTSAAAPLWTAIAAGVGAKREAAHLPALGAWGPHVHRLGMSTLSDSSYFHIDKGNNGDYIASPYTDYDNVCGWGSPRGHQFVAAMTR